MTDLTKDLLRKILRARRKAYVDALPANVHALMFHRPPAPLLAHIPQEAVIGLYHAGPFEAPAAAYARFFRDAGHTLALPYFVSRSAPMIFRHHTDPYAQNDLEVGPFGILQPPGEAKALIPEVLFVPLLGFTAEGTRLGQGGGHYDRWLADHRPLLAVGLAWDAQACDALPTQPHDAPLDAVVTPTRIYGHSFA
jgi:5-formyltetrahydrofolate cyclo-ligase